MAASPPAAPGPDNTRFGSAEYVRLQQELIAVRTRLDRQIAQLTRLNRLSNALLGQQLGGQGLESFAETIPDVLDMAIGVVWELQDQAVRDMALFGLTGDLPDWSTLGLELLARLEASASRQAIRLDPAELPALADRQLCDVLVCRCLDSEGRCIGVVMAANTLTVAGLFDPISDETLGVLTQMAERFAAHLEYRRYQELLVHRLELQESEERLQRVLLGTNDGWWDWDLRSGTCLLSSRWITMLGGEASGATVREGFWLDRVAAAERADFEQRLRQALEGPGQETFEREVTLLRDDGRPLPVLVRGRVSRDDDGTAVRFSGTILDLTERKRHEAHVHRLAYFDPLTELPNRRALMEELPRVIERCRQQGERLALLMIDLDNFKKLNDTHGHAAGDELLHQVGERLRAGVRGHDIVARLGGDEFVVMLEAIGHDPLEAERNAQRVAQGLLEQLSRPYELEVGVSHHGASIGLAVLDHRSASADALMQNADMALYDAKACGRGLVRQFDPAMQLRVNHRAQLERQLRAGLEGDQLRLHYQPIVDRQGQLCGAEALLRWQLPGQPPLLPQEFIPVAEESGLIHQLGSWNLQTVAAQLRQWQGQLRADFRLSLNLSASEFLHPDFVERMLRRIEELGIDGHRLRLEVTEATVLDDLSQAAQRMNRLRSHGLEFSLDDFGTGYSSISYLRELPFAEVKIDRSYVRSFLNDRHDAAIVRAMLSLCESLQIQLLAEGIETQEQWQRLHREGCSRFQGFLFGRPGPAGEKLAALLPFQPAQKRRPRREPRRGREVRPPA
ncbi:MAG: EAL domain-containing protein [Synechococcaceae cyanobacterium]|nr:EAL domain-containing protein [Synechococcaceae cyanobacterium]